MKEHKNFYGTIIAFLLTVFLVSCGNNDKANVAIQKVTGKPDTLVFKGLFLGMPIEDAHQVLKGLMPNGNIPDIEVDENKEKHIMVMELQAFGFETNTVYILADELDKVKLIVIMGIELLKWFDAQELPAMEFMTTFMRSYGIPHDGIDPITGGQDEITYTHRDDRGFKLTFNCYAPGSTPMSVSSLVLSKIPTKSEKTSKFN